MDTDKALSVVSRQAPCSHDNANTELGNGKIWAACEDCGATFPQDRWENARQASKDFDGAISAIRDEIARLRDENAKLQSRVEYLGDAVHSLHNTRASLQDENAKLRKTIRDQMSCSMGVQRYNIDYVLNKLHEAELIDYSSTGVLALFPGEDKAMQKGE